MALLDFFSKRNKDTGAEMSFIDHLEELRWHIVRSVIAVLVGAIAIFIYVGSIVDKVILGPAHQDFVTYGILCKVSRFLHLGDSLCINNVKVSFLSNAMTEQFMSSFTIAFVGGFIIAFPYVFWEFWKFVKPALKPSELKNTRFIILFVSFFFFLGGMPKGNDPAKAPAHHTADFYLDESGFDVGVKAFCEIVFNYANSKKQ